MRRGEVWWAELEPRSGSEQRGTRPVVVLSRDAFNVVEAWRSIVVVPLSTSARQAARGPTSIRVPRGTAGLTREGVAVCHQVTTLDRSKLVRRVGTLPAAVLREVEEGLKVTLDLA